MKTPAAIVRSTVDLDEAASHITVAMAGVHDAERVATRHEKLGTAARETAKLRRIEVGMWLAKVRATLPWSGPKAKGWSEFLARVKIDDSTAVRYIEVARASSCPQDSAHERDVSRIENNDQTGPRIVPAPRGADVLFAELTPDQVIDAIQRLKPEDRKRVLRDGKANLQGGSGEVERGTWCTAKEWAVAVGPWEHDPFSNPRSHILSVTRCMLEDGGDGFGGGEPGLHPGHYLLGERHGSRTGVADELTRVWLQPRSFSPLVAETVPSAGVEPASLAAVPIIDG